MRFTFILSMNDHGLSSRLVLVMNYDSYRMFLPGNSLLICTGVQSRIKKRNSNRLLMPSENK